MEGYKQKWRKFQEMTNLHKMAQVTVRPFYYMHY